MSRPRTEARTEAGFGGAGRALAAATALAALVAGCSDIYLDRRETIALGANDAVAANAVEQMVDPWPPYSNNKNLTFNGERMQRAVECYRIDRVTTPTDLNPVTDTGAPPPPPGLACEGQMSAGSAQPAIGAPIGEASTAAK